MSGPFKRYRVYEFMGWAVDCDHCPRRIGAGHRFIRYGDAGKFLCCLHCVRWRGVPSDGRDNLEVQRITTDAYVALARDKPDAHPALWMPIGRRVTDKRTGHSVVVWIDPEARDARVVVFSTETAELYLLNALNPVRGEPCTHPRPSDPNAEDEIDAEWQRLNPPYGGLDPDDLQREFDRMADEDDDE